ncbi:NrfD/PsrC family molybdoenzyme membrane anchor subunit [Sedimenticola hydrogenitrophicus]|uniref:NrfD/PsrC family molybdoenzyme membrane anchor subunit n=1 Tax=Sedimenticola hydrogenitrophicus TaxID=2967975 RepID=UPI0023B1F509|nr:NrfD/PsrC family molybdoenzyme membrane anchor subunit [Sedimenticola hydrogenitrophicus]
MSNNIIEIIGITQEITWNSWAVQYFFFIGLSVGGVLLAAPAYLSRTATWLPVARLGLLVAITTGLVAPVALLADLHQPARFYQFYLNFTPSSWMSWGAFLLPAYIAALLLFGLQGLYRDPAGNQRVTRMAALATSVLGTGIALYTGSEMGILISRVLWQSGWLVPAYLLSGLAGAIGLALVINSLQSTENLAHSRLLLRWLTASLALTGVWIGAWAVAGYLNLSGSGAALLRLAVEFRPLETLVFWIGVGLLLPLILTLFNHTGLNLMTGLLALFGTWMLRWVMFIGGQGIPKNGAGFYNFELPLTADGLLGILGSIGLWLLILIVIRSLLSQYKQPADV